MVSAPVSVCNFRVGDLPTPGELPTLWGQPVEQMLTACCAFDRLFAVFRPRRIIEIGTGCGGFTAYLAVWAHRLQARIVTIDNRDYADSFRFLDDLALALPLTRRQANYRTDPAIVTEFVEYFAPSLLLCDGDTEKGEQLRLYAPYLRAGSVLMAHDYKSPGGQVSPSEIDEIVHVYGYQLYMQEMFDSYQSHWLCLRKT